MKKCPFCAESIQDEAIKCKHCNEFLDGRAGISTMGIGYRRSYEYKSKIQILGWPLVHIAQGMDPQTGRMRIARGIIAIGNIAVGLIAIGGIALGGLCLGGLSLGILALGGLAAGGAALGGMAIGLYLAVGGIAISLNYAIGGLAIAKYTISSAGIDPEFLDKIKEDFPRLYRKFFPR